MPGDIITLHDAKLKGSEGIQGSRSGIDEGITAVGIVGEYGPRRSIVRVYQASKSENQHTRTQVGTSTR